MTAPDRPSGLRAEAEGGPWTRHGHDIVGVTVAGSGRPSVARCGGPTLCQQCAQDVLQAHGGAGLPLAPAEVLAGHAVTKLRKHAEEHDDDEIEALLAEYDRRGAEVKRLLDWVTDLLGIDRQSRGAATAWCSACTYEPDLARQVRRNWPGLSSLLDQLAAAHGVEESR